MRQLLVLAAGIAGAFGVVTFTVAQDATPSPSPAAVCASPVAGTPLASTPTIITGTPAATPEPCPSAAAAVTIELIDIAFKPDDVTITSGTTITLRNTGQAPHNFTIQSLGINVDVAPGETKTVTIDAPPGDYTFICAVIGHAQAGMDGVLHVQ